MFRAIARMLNRPFSASPPEPASNPFAYDPNARGSLEAWSVDNWILIPEADRERCLDHLRIVIGKAIDGPAVMDTWRRQVEAGLEIGSNDVCFHFGTGMMIRNRLRDVMLDDQLPQIRLPNGQLGQNWDDFYLGALHALVQSHPGYLMRPSRAVTLRRDPCLGH